MFKGYDLYEQMLAVLALIRFLMALSDICLSMLRHFIDMCSMIVLLLKQIVLESFKINKVICLKESNLLKF